MFFRKARLEPVLIDSRIQTDGSDLKPDESGCSENHFPKCLYYLPVNKN